MTQKPIGKSISRIVAVQVLYELEFSASDNINELITKKTSELKEDKKSFKQTHKLEGYPDKNYLVKLVEGVCAEKDALAVIVQPCLSEKITYDSLNPIIRFIFLLAAYEMHRLETPFKVAINEYMRVAKGFCSEKELGLVNGVLDAIAHKNV